MQLDFGIARLDVPDANYLPTLVVGVGRDDTAPGATMAHGSGSGGGQRRSLTVSFAPLPENAEPTEVIAAELQKLASGPGGEIAHSRDREMHGNPGKLTEIKFAGPAGMAMVTLVYIGHAHGFLQTFMISALDGEHMDAVRADFERIIDTIQLGAFFTR